MNATSAISRSNWLIGSLALTAGGGSAAMAVAAWWSGNDTLIVSAICFSLAYVCIYFLCRYDSISHNLKPWALMLLSSHCVYIACVAQLSPAPSYALLPSLVAWLMMYHDRSLLRIIGGLHLALAVCCYTYSVPGSIEVPWLSIIVLAFVVLAFAVASANNTHANRSYWYQMQDLQLEMEHSELMLQRATAKLEQQRDELAKTSSCLKSTVAMNLHQTAELQFANAERAQVARAASSDLKQPLRNISSFIQLIRRRLQKLGLAQDVREYLDFVTDGAARMDCMIDDLLRYTNQSETSEAIPINTQELLMKIQQNLQNLLSREGGLLIIEGQLPEIYGQPTQVLQLFQNLISNGIKFKRPGVQPSCRVSCELVDGVANFCVSDNGIGIPSNRLADVFGLFTRLHERGTYEGTGIGLATCRRIVIAAGGNIWAESEVGVGTSFRFTWPLATSEVVGSHSAAQIYSPPKQVLTQA